MLQFLQELPVNITLSGSIRDEVPQVTYFGLADAMDAAEALFQTIWIPRQVVVHHQMSALEINAFTGGIGCK